MLRTNLLPNKTSIDQPDGSQQLMELLMCDKEEDVAGPSEFEPLTLYPPKGVKEKAQSTNGS